MKLLISSIITIGTFSPIISLAQQVTNFPVCTNYQENYFPGGYDAYGNYIQGGVTTNQNNFNCTTGQPYPQGRSYTNVYRGSNVYNGYNPLNGYCNPTRTLFGAVLGGAIGRALTSTANNRRNRGWATALGASLGGLYFSC
jgi:hypothetical protein